MIQLNCDLGESFGIWKMGEDEAIIPLIDMANIACGFHASDPLNMSKTLKLAIKHNLQLGAHPSYPDLLGFGRRTIPCSTDEIKTLILYQVGALRALANSYGADISYVKPHGALYNDMMQNRAIFEAINEALYSYDKSLKLMVLSTPNNKKLKSNAKVELLFEIFADRAYSSDGFLVPRNQANALLSKDGVLQRVTLLQKEGVIYANDNTPLQLEADTICVHGDNKEALELVKTIRGILDNGL